MATASIFASPAFSLLSRNKSGKYNATGKGASGRTHHVVTMRLEKPLEELYHVRVERKVSQERLAELGISRWSMWKTGKCNLAWDWQADQLVYIEEGEVRVVPHGSDRYMQFLAGDLLRYPIGLKRISGSTGHIKNGIVSEHTGMIFSPCLTCVL